MGSDAWSVLQIMDDVLDLRSIRKPRKTSGSDISSGKRTDCDSCAIKWQRYAQFQSSFGNEDALKV